MRIAIGTLNPGKIEPTKRILLKEWPHAKIITLSVDSGISDMPTTDEELIQGARNRAKNAMEAASADMGVGIEGGTIENRHGMFLAGWVIIIDKKGIVGMGAGPRSQLPGDVRDAINSGKELGPYLENRFPEKGPIRTANGAFGIFTADRMTRPENFDIAIRCALSPFVTDFFK